MRPSIGAPLRTGPPRDGRRRPFHETDRSDRREPETRAPGTVRAAAHDGHEHVAPTAEQRAAARVGTSSSRIARAGHRQARRRGS